MARSTGEKIADALLWEMTFREGFGLSKVGTSEMIKWRAAWARIADRIIAESAEGNDGDERSDEEVP